MTVTEKASLAQILKISLNDDVLEEDAMDYLDDRNIPLYSHSRSAVLEQAFRAGWRP